ncbi:hypothetical protein D3C83_228670 [compost metagenome]
MGTTTALEKKASIAETAASAMNVTAPGSGYRAIRAATRSIACDIAAWSPADAAATMSAARTATSIQSRR